MRLLENSFWKQYFLVPLLSILSLFLFPLILYWYPDMLVEFYFGRTYGLEDLKISETSLDILMEKVRTKLITHVMIMDTSKKFHVIPIKIKDQRVFF